MTEEPFVSYVVLWTDAGTRHLLDFDTPDLAIRCAMQLEAQGKVEISVSTQSLDEAPGWCDAARERVWESIVGKLQEDNVHWRLVAHNAIHVKGQKEPIA